MNHVLTIDVSSPQSDAMDRQTAIRLQNIPIQSWCPILRRLSFLPLFLMFWFQAAVAEESTYRRVQLLQGISIEIPANWTVFSQETLKRNVAAGQAITKKAGIEAPAGRKEYVLAVNAVPDPTGAMIRVSVASPPDFTQADLAAATPNDLKAIGAGMERTLKQMESASKLRIIEVQPVRIETVKNHRMLVMPYIRAGTTETSPWLVTQYKVPVSGHLIEITLSNRQSDSAVWAPILKRVIQSLRF